MAVLNSVQYRYYQRPKRRYGYGYTELGDSVYRYRIRHTDTELQIPNSAIRYTPNSLYRICYRYTEFCKSVCRCRIRYREFGIGREWFHGIWFLVRERYFLHEILRGRDFVVQHYELATWFNCFPTFWEMNSRPVSVYDMDISATEYLYIEPSLLIIIYFTSYADEFECVYLVRICAVYIFQRMCRLTDMTI
jgi:hypothetical protein